MADSEPLPMSRRQRANVERWRVPLGFAAVAVYLIFAQPTWRSIAAGIPIAMLGLGIRAWASGHLRKNVRLAVTGPYAYSRNPLYFGSAVMLSGALISSGNLFLAIGLLGLFLLVYYPVMSSEADRMRSLFGADYERWEATVPLFIPRLVPRRVDSGERFEAELYLQHREYRAFVGLAVLYGLLVLKLVLWN